MESLVAEAAVIFLAVCGNVALQLNFCAKGLTTKDAAVNTALVLQMTVLDMQLKVSLMTEIPITRRTAVDFLLIAVFDCKMKLS